jgi:hypothetical protein
MRNVTKPPDSWEFGRYPNLVPPEYGFRMLRTVNTVFRSSMLPAFGIFMKKNILPLGWHFMTLCCHMKASCVMLYGSVTDDSCDCDIVYLYLIFVRKHLRKLPLGSPRRLWRGGVVILRWILGRWIELALDRVQWWALVLAVLNLRVLLPELVRC